MKIQNGFKCIQLKELIVFAVLTVLYGAVGNAVTSKGAVWHFSSAATAMVLGILLIGLSRSFKRDAYKAAVQEIPHLKRVK